MDPYKLNWKQPAQWLLVLLLIPLHLYNCVASMFFPGLHSSHGLNYPLEAYTVSLLWLAIVLAIDVLLILGRPVGPARVLRWYWALSCMLLVLAMLLGERFFTLIVWAMFLPPVPLLIPLLDPMPVLFDFFVEVMFWTALFCLIQWCLCLLPLRRKS